MRRAAFTAAVLALSATASSLYAEELSLGSAVIASIDVSNCGPAESTLTRTACLSIAISGCPDNVDNRTARAKVTAQSGAIVASVLFFAGGDGGGLYEQAFTEAPALGLLANVRDAGLRVVQVFWPDAGGVFGASQANVHGPLSLMCRVATLIAAIHANATINPSGGRLRATGNSGGSSQLLYALARYGSATYLSRVVATGGPPHGDLTLGCTGLIKPTYVTACPGLKTVPGGNCQLVSSAYGQIGTGFIDASYGDSRSVCSSRVDGANLHYDSICGGPATLVYPATTTVTFLYGDTDGSEATPIGRSCANKFVGATIQTCESGAAGHSLPNATDCASDIYAALVN